MNFIKVIVIIKEENIWHKKYQIQKLILEQRLKEKQNKNCQKTIRKKLWHKRNNGTDRINGRRNQKNRKQRHYLKVT